MSLVSDALKKAQREAAAREAREKGLPEQLVTSSQPYRARRSPGIRTLVVAVAAAVVAGATVAWFLLARPAVGPEAVTTSVPAPPPAASADPAPTATAEAPLKEEREPAAGASARAMAPAVAASAPPVANLPASPEAASGSTASMESNESASATAASGAAPAPSPSAPTARPGAGERAFVREARLDDGVEIRLGGIAWSDVAPLAYLNGRLLGIGESVSGWTVERIDRDGVRLSGVAGTIRIALR